MPTLGIALAVIGLVVAPVGVWRYSRSVGATCVDDYECNTHNCLVLPTGGGMCTRTCADDAACPDDTVCATATRGPTNTRSTRRQVCTPTGARLLELLQ